MKRFTFDVYPDEGVISPIRMRVVRQNAIALGVTELQLMESTGRALANTVCDYSPARVLVLCGRGNNGGAGMVAARHLQYGVNTDVFYINSGNRNAACEHQLAALKRCRVGLFPFICRDDLEALKTIFDRADIIVDALLGIEAYGELREPLKTCVRMANIAHAKIVAADVPTPGMRADKICAFHRAKIKDSTVIDIGIPLEAECCVGPGDLTLIKSHRLKAHKGVGGEVLVIGGGPYQGAPYLVGLGALRAGADIVRIASPVFEPIPDLIYERLEGAKIGEEHIEHLIVSAERADVVVCGNGLGVESHAVVTAIAPHCKRAVFDAEALRLPLPAAKEATIYTPHAGEFSRITGKTLPGDTIGRATVARDVGICGTVLLKGHIDVITDGTRVRFNRTGNPAMTVGGTGDVLAGIAGALLVHLHAFDAACIAAYVNGRAGAWVAGKRGRGMLASDLVDRIPVELFKDETQAEYVHGRVYSYSG